jgi:serine/threonine-protein kinase
MEFSPGEVVEGRFKTIRKIGEGGMGQVYEGYDLAQDRPVALKFLDPALVDDPTWLSRFRREAMAVTKIGHPSICQVYDTGATADHVPYIVMELLKGRDLLQEIAATGTLSEVRLVWTILPVLSALSKAHSYGIVHRDLKPENIFISLQPDGTTRVKLLDFGVSKILDEANALALTKTGTILGTPWYMSPEQARGLKSVDHRSDLWSMGVVIYEALTGKLPFKGDSYNVALLAIIFKDPTPLSTYLPFVRPNLEAVISRTLNKDPDQRYQSADELAEALELSILDDRETVPG